MKNIHIKAAYLFGILLPLGETIRRGSEGGYWPNYLDDYFMGIILIRSVQHLPRERMC